MLLFIRKARNRAFFNDLAMNSGQLLVQIRRYVADTFISQKICLSKGHMLVACIHYFNLKATPPPTKDHLITWKPLTEDGLS